MTKQETEAIARKIEGMNNSVDQKIDSICKKYAQSQAKREQPVTVKVYRSTPKGMNLIATHNDVGSVYDEYHKEDGCLVIEQEDGKVVARYRPLSTTSYTIEEQEGETDYSYAVASLHFSLSPDGEDVEQRLDNDLRLMSTKLGQQPKDADGLDDDNDSDEFLAYITSPHEKLIQEHVDVFGALHDRELIESNQWLSHGQDILSHFVMISDQYGHEHYYQVFMAPTPGRRGDQEIREVRLVWFNCGPDSHAYYEGICRPMLEHLKRLADAKGKPKKKGGTSPAATIDQGAA